MIKKLTSLLLVITLILSAVSAFAEEKEITPKQQNSINLMKAIGIFGDKTDYSANIKRNELARAVYVLQNGSDAGVSAAEVFADINSDTEYLNEISYAYSMGFMNGYMGEWRPDGEATFAEIAAAAVRILGIEFLVDASKGYPSEYIRLANEYGVTKGIYAGADSTVENYEAAMIFENILNVKFTDAQYNKNGISGYYMTAMLNISKARGIMTDNGYTNLDGKEPVKNSVLINNVRYDTNGIDCEGYIGKNIEIYYKEDSDGMYSLLTVNLSANQDILHIESEKIKDFGGRTYTYDVSNNRTKKAKLSSTYNIIYNGRLVTDSSKLTDDMMKPDEGYIELIDSDDDGSYELLVIADYITFVVDEYNERENIVRSENGVKEIKLDDADVRCEMYITDGKTNVAIEARNIGHNGYVLSMARSLDDKYIVIYLAQETVSGMITSIDREAKSISAGGNDYIVSRKLESRWNGGMNAKLHLNQYGHIIWAENADSDTVKYAYLVNVYPDNSGDGAVIKLYDEDNTYLTGNAGNSIYIDGSKYTDMSKVRNELTDKKYTIVRYKVNSKNEITWIDTDNLNLSTEKDYDSLNKLYENASESDSASAAFDKDLYAFGERYKSKNPTSKDTVVFCTQKTYQDGMIYCYTIDEFVSTYAGSSETQIGELILYNTDINSMIGKAALVKRDILGIGTNTRSSKISSAAVVTKISSAVNDDNDIGYMLEVTMNDSTENIFVDSDALNFGDNGKYTSGANKYTIEVGDIIQWGSDIYGNIKAGNVIVIYDWDRDALTSKLNNTAIYKYENAWHPLWLYDKEESWLKTVNSNQTPIDKFEDGSVTESGLSTYIDYTVPINGKTVKVYVFDKTIKKLAESDLGEMQSYKQYGTDCTRMIGRYSQYGGHRIFVIYK